MGWSFKNLWDGLRGQTSPSPKKPLPQKELDNLEGALQVLFRNLGLSSDDTHISILSHPEDKQNKIGIGFKTDALPYHLLLQTLFESYFGQDRIRSDIGGGYNQQRLSLLFEQHPKDTSYKKLSGSLAQHLKKLNDNFLNINECLQALRTRFPDKDVRPIVMNQLDAIMGEKSWTGSRGHVFRSVTFNQTEGSFTDALIVIVPETHLEDPLIKTLCDLNKVNLEDTESFRIQRTFLNTPLSEGHQYAFEEEVITDSDEPESNEPEHGGEKSDKEMSEDLDADSANPPSYTEEKVDYRRVSIPMRVLKKTLAARNPKLLRAGKAYYTIESHHEPWKLLNTLNTARGLSPHHLRVLWNAQKNTSGKGFENLAILGFPTDNRALCYAFVDAVTSKHASEANPERKERISRNLRDRIPNFKSYFYWLVHKKGSGHASSQREFLQKWANTGFSSIVDSVRFKHNDVAYNVLYPCAFTSTAPPEHDPIMVGVKNAYDNAMHKNTALIMQMFVENLVSAAPDIDQAWVSKLTLQVRTFQNNCSLSISVRGGIEPSNEVMVTLNKAYTALQITLKKAGTTLEQSTHDSEETENRGHGMHRSLWGQSWAFKHQTDKILDAYDLLTQLWTSSLSVYGKARKESRLAQFCPNTPTDQLHEKQLRIINNMHVYDPNP